MDGKYRNTVTGRLISTDGVVYKKQSKNTSVLQAVIRRRLYVNPDYTDEPIAEKTYKFGFEDLPDDVKDIITEKYYESLTKNELRRILKIKQDEVRMNFSGYTKAPKKKLIRYIKTIYDVAKTHFENKAEKKQKPKKEKKVKIGITDLVFTYEDFDRFYSDAWGWGHCKLQLPLQKIADDLYDKGERYIEGAIIKTTKSERTKLLKGKNAELALRLGFNTDKYGYVEFILTCDYDDKVFYHLLRASGIDAYGGGYTFNENGKIREEDEDEDDKEDKDKDKEKDDDDDDDDDEDN